MRLDQEKSNTTEDGRWSTLALPQERDTPSLYVGRESFPGPVGRRFLGDVMFGRNRKAIREHNEDVLRAYAGFKLYSILRDMDERLQAANPDYTLIRLGIALYRDGHDAQLWIDLKEQDWPSQQDLDMAKAIIDTAEKEIREHYGR